MRPPQQQRLRQLRVAGLVALVRREVERADAGVRHRQGLRHEVRALGQRERVLRPVEPHQLAEAAHGHPRAPRHELEQLREPPGLLGRGCPGSHGAPEPRHQLAVAGQALRVCSVLLPIIDADLSEPTEELRQLGRGQDAPQLLEHRLRDDPVQPTRHCSDLWLDSTKHPPLGERLHELCLILVRHDLLLPGIPERRLGNVHAEEPHARPGACGAGHPVLSLDHARQHSCG
mmetsp:Transcript_3911/g.11138  ORF Transcript_3911/g.11138 Transcript_3911/m.11138 type:complete len:231 (+) Transcript_3911:84-776(+)